MSSIVEGWCYIRACGPYTMMYHLPHLSRCLSCDVSLSMWYIKSVLQCITFLEPHVIYHQFAWCIPSKTCVIYHVQSPRGLRDISLICVMYYLQSLWSLRDTSLLKFARPAWYIISLGIWCITLNSKLVRLVWYITGLRDASSWKLYKRLVWYITCERGLRIILPSKLTWYITCKYTVNYILVLEGNWGLTRNEDQLWGELAMKGWLPT